MTATPEYLNELRGLLRKLKKARFTGAKRVVFGERDVTYKSDDDMRQAQRELEGEIAEMERGLDPIARRPRSRSRVMVFRRG